MPGALAFKLNALLFLHPTLVEVLSMMHIVYLSPRSLDGGTEGLGDCGKCHH